MVPFKETIETKQELIEACKKGFEEYSNKRISKNDFCMFFGFTHGEAITKFYERDYEKLLIDGGFNSGSSAYFSAGINAWKNLRDGKYEFPPFAHNQSNPCTEKTLPLQQIFYGAPGTGKSHTIKSVVEEGNLPHIRTTFHPDSDYSTFVGAYKPTTIQTYRFGLNGSTTIRLKYPDGDKTGQPIKDCKIEYRFVKQAFLKAYIQAWKYVAKAENLESAKYQFLIIEEINRGNCAQIFGDLFQLLDRKNGFSEYPIETDEDIHKCLLSTDTEIDPSFGETGLQFSEQLKNAINEVYNSTDDEVPFRNVADEISQGKVLVLPPNLYIWATMNTSDQSLFPIDSAFKRRWDWKYIRISEGNGKDGKPLNYRIQFKTTDGNIVDVSWWEFVKSINKDIEDATKSEDKKLGYFFCKPDKKAKDDDETNTIISAETFVGKVVFYLWQDVFKDYGFKSDIFQKDNGEKISFHDFYPDNITTTDDNPEAIDLDLLKRFIDKVMKKTTSDTTDKTTEE